MQLSKICLKYEIPLIYPLKSYHMKMDAWQGFLMPRSPLPGGSDLNIQLVPSAVHGPTRSPGGNTSGERIVDNKLVVSVTHKNHDLLVIYK